MRRSPAKSPNKFKNFKLDHSSKCRLARFLVNDLKNYGPANLIHIGAISSFIGRPIRIWHLNHRVCTLNESSPKNPVIDIEYHECKPNSVGHWTLLGNRDPAKYNVDVELNSCLFAVVAAQIGEKPTNLRTNVITFLKNDPKNLVTQIDKFLIANNGALMNGGARYIGTTPSHAGTILDNSQNVLCHGCRAYGHPRGHASHRNATGDYDSVENYSRLTRSMKSGFLSRSDQNRVAHLSLRHEKARLAMQELNNGSTSEVVALTRRELNNNNNSLPKMREYYDGEPIDGEQDIMQVKLIMRHHNSKYRDADADVFVHTFYPMS
ncbi:uncharacterized protein LOC108623210 [Ceratina calcarata]|uniref:Uncharacterized protein LOC108623210 n=1 Tax=Ceratina calcarata TaxID=156304 RepID=A0AAJ7N4E6_9HYME|nr:uncharacterized protein LOC108623210 [Ceratina calcarata]